MKSERPARVLVAALMVLVAFSAFLPALQNGFVNWDDGEILSGNPHYRGLGWGKLRWMWTTFHMGHWMPLTWMTFGLDYLLWGMDPFGYHLTSLLLHTANALLVYFLALRLFGLALPGAFELSGAGRYVAAGLAALLFAVHPLRVESVAWATERRDVLSGLFYLLTILAYLRAQEPPHPNPLPLPLPLPRWGRGEEVRGRQVGERRRGRGRGWYWGAVGLCACALLSKAMAVSLPVILLLLDVYPLRRLGGAWGWWGLEARRVYLEKLPFVGLAGAAAAIAFLAVAGHAPLAALGVGERLALSVYGLGFYLWKMVAPFNLSPLYPMPAQVNVWGVAFVLSYGVVVGFTALAVALRRRAPGLLGVWAAYVVILLPVLGLFHNGPQIAADRYTYLASLGWALLAGAGLLLGWSWRAVPLRGLAVCVVLGLGVLSWGQAQVWRDSETLWSHALSIGTESSIAHNNLGTALARQGKLAEAAESFREALRLQPDHAEARNNWGNVLARQGQLAEAVEHYREALRLKPDYAKAHINWGVVVSRQGKFDEAIEHFRQALLIDPDLAEAHDLWGLALAEQGRLTEAVEHYREALRLKPEFAEAHDNLGSALAQQEKSEEAIAHYREALRLRPDFAEAHNNLGWALARHGGLSEAIKHYQRALSLRPDFPQARANLLRALAGQRGQENGKPEMGGK